MSYFGTTTRAKPEYLARNSFVVSKEAGMLCAWEPSRRLKMVEVVLGQIGKSVAILGRDWQFDECAGRRYLGES